ncbi:MULTISPECIES: hypothetical protein [Colwellia]|uniref:Transporter n=1 Tax=Colwellia marinimaniae TaxID=1513592 RepID=A0ABQ0MRB5_9GAMM|nr:MULTISPECIES: hypothetical protein [Colwellia]GAW94883.1 hypothetical protein MTCD1_00481 [Colwellia marinimaniae]
MKKLTTSLSAIANITLLSLLNVPNAHSMGLRSFVALPLDKHGYVVRFLYEHITGSSSGNFHTSTAYGLSNDQALLFSIPYKITANDENHFGELSALYRHTVMQDDFFSGTARLALLAGAIVPMNNVPSDASDNVREPAVQAGFVYTFFQGRHEFDIDALYQAGINSRADSGRYDISWQYRLSPSVYPDWGIGSELYVVTELNGRWQEADEITHQVTLGLQWLQPTWVIEGGIVKNLTNNNDLTVLFSSRFHF